MAEIENMKGIKQIFGWAIGLIGLGILFEVGIVMTFIEIYKMIFGFILIAAGYFLGIAGLKFK